MKSPLRCHYSQVHSDIECKYLLGSHLLVKNRFVWKLLILHWNTWYRITANYFLSRMIICCYYSLRKIIIFCYLKTNNNANKLLLLNRDYRTLHSYNLVWAVCHLFPQQGWRTLTYSISRNHWPGEPHNLRKTTSARKFSSCVWSHFQDTYSL